MYEITAGEAKPDIALEFKGGTFMPDKKDGCISPAAGPIVPEAEKTSEDQPQSPKKEVTKMMAKVGKRAPDFEANGFYQGGFNNFKLSDYKDKWVLLCFYPGDFTYV
jgi:hypothetical protein